MGDLLSIIAIVGLVALVIVSVTRQRAVMTQTKADEDLVPREPTSSAIVPCRRAEARTSPQDPVA